MINTIQDDSGNKIVVEGDNLYLCLKEDNRKRHIGVLNKAAKVLSMKRDRKRHLHYKSNSYGFNYQVLSQGTKFNKILIRDNVESFLVPLEFLLEKGRFLYFKQQGFERQIFITLDELKEHKILNTL